jgi:thymidylate synthase (FAD)
MSDALALALAPAPAPAPAVATVSSAPVVAPAAPKKIYMPDGIGYIELLEVFGDDLTVVNAARVSFDKVSESLTEADKKLIRYLAKHEHNSPFFHPQVRLRVKMPIFVTREWYRHTIGLSRNEISRRYVNTVPECWVPAVEDLREKDKNVKQGSKENPIDGAEEVHDVIAEHVRGTVGLYESLLTKGVAPEVARCILPQSMYTEFIETGSLAAMARICHLRLGSGAQKEIREYAAALSCLMTEAFPVSWEALRLVDGAKP